MTEPSELMAVTAELARERERADKAELNVIKVLGLITRVTAERDALRDRFTCSNCGNMLDYLHYSKGGSQKVYCVGRETSFEPIPRPEAEGVGE